MRGGIAERGGIRVGHRIIEINGQSVVATTQDKIIQILSNAVGEVRVDDNNTLLSCNFNTRALLKLEMHRYQLYMYVYVYVYTCTCSVCTLMVNFCLYWSKTCDSHSIS